MILGLTLITVVSVLAGTLYKGNRSDFISDHYDNMESDFNGGPKLLRLERRDRTFIIFASAALAVFIAWVMTSVQLNMLEVGWSDTTLNYIKFFATFQLGWAIGNTISLRKAYKNAILQMEAAIELFKEFDNNADKLKEEIADAKE